MSAALPGGESTELARRCAEVERLAASSHADAGEELARLLSDPSWYLRERVVHALSTRSDAGDTIRRALREGEWWARASASDVIGRRADVSAVPDLVAGIEDRNVSLQKSAVRALAAVAERAGVRVVAEELGALEPGRRRRVLARIGHQVPHIVEALEGELARLPQALPAVPVGAASRAGTAEDEVDARVLVRFREWLDSAGPAARGGHA